MDLEHSVATEAWNFRYYSITTAKIFEYLLLQFLGSFIG